MRFIFALLFFFSPLLAENDQLTILFGSSGYALYRAIDFAFDHGFRYVRILSYEFSAEGHELKALSHHKEKDEGRYFEIKDPYLSLRFLCFTKRPKNGPFIEVKKYETFLQSTHDILE